MSNENMNTEPTIATLLTRMNEWGEKLTAENAEIRSELADLRKGQDELRKGQDELRKDLNTGLRRIERKIEILNDNLLTIKADIRDLEVRVEKLESESVVKS